MGIPYQYPRTPRQTNHYSVRARMLTHPLKSANDRPVEPWESLPNHGYDHSSAELR